MGKNFKIFLGISYLIILTLFLYFIFSYVQLSRLNEFSYYKEIQFILTKFIDESILINSIFYFLFSIIWIVLLGFASPLLIISGILFGKWIGTFITISSISIGSLILYVIANFFFSDLVNKLLRQRFLKYIDKFREKEFYYFFAFRLAGGLGLPFFLQNTLPVLFNMKKLNYFLASLLGLVPHFFIWNSVGAGLNNYIMQADSFNIFELILSKEIYLPIIMFLFLILVSILIKRKFFDEKI